MQQAPRLTAMQKCAPTLSLRPVLNRCLAAERSTQSRAEVCPHAHPRHFLQLAAMQGAARELLVLLDPALQRCFAAARCKLRLLQLGVGLPWLTPHVAHQGAKFAGCCRIDLVLLALRPILTARHRRCVARAYSLAVPKPTLPLLSATQLRMNQCWPPHRAAAAAAAAGAAVAGMLAGRLRAVRHGVGAGSVAGCVAHRRPGSLPSKRAFGATVSLAYSLQRLADTIAADA